MEDVLVQRLEEPHVVVGYGGFSILNALDGLRHVVAYGPDAQHGYVGAVVEPSSGSHLDGLQGAAPVFEHAAAAGVAYDEWSLAVHLCGVHQPSQLVLVHGRGDGQVGYGAQGRQVEGAVVRRPVFAHQSGAV